MNLGFRFKDLGVPGCGGSGFRGLGFRVFEGFTAQSLLPASGVNPSYL